MPVRRFTEHPGPGTRSLRLWLILTRMGATPRQTHNLWRTCAANWHEPGLRPSRRRVPQPDCSPLP